MFIKVTDAIAGPVLVNTDHIHAVYMDKKFTENTVIKTNSTTIYATEPFEVVEAWIRMLDSSLTKETL